MSHWMTVERPRTHRFRRADALGDFRVARSLAGRDRAQRSPDPLLKVRAAHVERQIESERRRLHEADDPGHP